MKSSVGTMIVGLLLSLGMGALLLFWLDQGEGSGITGFLFMFGMLAGIGVVWKGANRS